MPSIAIVMPAFIQTEQQLGWWYEALASIERQSFKEWELLVVDDGSPIKLDGPEEGQVRLIHHDRRRGAGAARNTGIAAATADYLLCLDADDRLLPDGLARLWDGRCPNGVIYGDLVYIGDREGPHYLPEWSLELLLRGQSSLPITALHPREAWRKVGGFDERVPGLEDVDYWIKLAERGYCGQRIPHQIFEYRRHGSSRQAGLEANNRQRMRDVLGVLQQRHRKVMVEMSDVQRKCSKCPGSGGQGTGVSNMLPPEVGSDTARLRYVGPMNGSFQAHGFATGARYFINGRGDTIIVDVRDVAGLLKRHTGGRPDFEQLEDIIAPPVEASGSEVENPPADLPEITSLKVDEAKALIETTGDQPDLAVWLAEERASKKPRQSVIDALEARLNGLSEGI